MSHQQKQTKNPVRGLMRNLFGLDHLGKRSRLGYLDLIGFLLSIVILIELMAGMLLNLSPEVQKLILWSDHLICFYFLLLFFINLIRAPNKLAYLKWGWIDLISSIPQIEYFHYGQVFRIFRILRLLRVYKSADQMMRLVFKDRRTVALVSVIMVMFLLMLGASIAILGVETAPNSNIKTAEDALWWSYVTITTVGYGDVYPVTRAGRLIAGLLIAAGVGVFGTLAGYMSSFFSQQYIQEEVQQLEENIQHELEDEFKKVQEEVAKIEDQHHTDHGLKQ